MRDRCNQCHPAAILAGAVNFILSLNTKLLMLPAVNYYK